MKSALRAALEGIGALHQLRTAAVVRQSESWAALSTEHVSSTEAVPLTVPLEPDEAV